MSMSPSCSKRWRLRSGRQVWPSEPPVIRFAIPLRHISWKAATIYEWSKNFWGMRT